jgi:hypothetical protein
MEDDEANNKVLDSPKKDPSDQLPSSFQVWIWFKVETVIVNTQNGFYVFVHRTAWKISAPLPVQVPLIRPL